jgi:hypothetical protein
MGKITFKNNFKLKFKKYFIHSNHQLKLKNHKREFNCSNFKNLSQNSKKMSFHKVCSPQQATNSQRHAHKLKDFSAPVCRLTQIDV